MLGVEVFFCGKFVENGPNAKKVYTYRVRGKFFFKNIVTKRTKQPKSVHLYSEGVKQ